MSKLFEIFRDWELIFILAKRDFKVKYKQSILGVGWAVIRPTLTLAIFVFGYEVVGKIKAVSDYPIILVLFTGIISWNYFSMVFQNVSNSILYNANLVTKVYFPRLILALSAIFTPAVDLVIGLILLLIAQLALGYPFNPLFFIYIIPSILVITCSALGYGLIMASFSVKYRDFIQIIPIITQYGFFMTPVVYTSKDLQSYHWYFYYNLINPMCGTIEAFRNGFLENYSIYDSNLFLFSGVSTLLVLLIGILIFNKREKYFVDDI